MSDLSALAVTVDRRGTCYALVIWLDHLRGKGGIAWPDQRWSVGDLADCGPWLDGWLSGQGLREADAETIAEVALVAWLALAGDDAAEGRLHAMAGVRSVVRSGAEYARTKYPPCGCTPTDDTRDRVKQAHWCVKVAGWEGLAPRAYRSDVPCQCPCHYRGAP